jgi:hypothetical protein
METIQAGFGHLLWENPMGEARKGTLRPIGFCETDTREKDHFKGLLR